MAANKAPNVAMQKAWVLGHDGEIKTAVTVGFELGNRVWNLLAGGLGTPDTLNLIYDNMRALWCP
ncbi:hypothetical protein D3C78_1937000 [compost metagenome]